MSFKQEELENLPWRFVFKFRYVMELRDFVRWIGYEMGYEEDEISVNSKTNSVIITSELIDPFASMAHRCVMQYTMVSIRMNKFQPGDRGVSD